MNAQLLHVVSEPLPASRKVYKPGTLHRELRVPMREITLHPAAGEPPLTVYDSSGPYTDPNQNIDIARGLPALRAAWIAARAHTEAHPRPRGRRPAPTPKPPPDGGCSRSTTGWPPGATPRRSLRACARRCAPGRGGR